MFLDRLHYVCSPSAKELLDLFVEGDNRLANMLWKELVLFSVGICIPSDGKRAEYRAMWIHKERNKNLAAKTSSANAQSELANQRKVSAFAE